MKCAAKFMLTKWVAGLLLNYMLNSLKKTQLTKNASLCSAVVFYKRQEALIHDYMKFNILILFPAR